MVYIVVSIVLVIIVLLFIGYITYKNLKDQKYYLLGQVRSLQKQISQLNSQANDKIAELRAAEEKLESLRADLFELISNKERVQLEYDNVSQLVEKEQRYLNDGLEQTKQAKLESLKLLYEQKNNELKDIYNANVEKYGILTQDMQSRYEVLFNSLGDTLNTLKKEYNALTEAILRQDKERLENLFYTIQVSEENQNDIHYLLTEVTKKVDHPTIINKLIWSEYIRPRLEETFKRICLEDGESGIYKITSIIDGKAYIGKSTNLKKRITEHVKGALDYSTIADQAIHHAMRAQGLWNWAFEVVEYCDKDKINEREKYYIELFQTEKVGYNKKGGG